MEAMLSWSGQQSGPLVVRSLQEFDRALADISSNTSESAPALVVLTAHGHEVQLVVGGPVSFVQVGAASGDPPYLVAVSDSNADGVVAFMLEGEHHTEVPAEHVLSSQRATDIVRYFVEHGRWAIDVRWKEV